VIFCAEHGGKLFRNLSGALACNYEWDPVSAWRAETMLLRPATLVPEPNAPGSVWEMLQVGEAAAFFPMGVDSGS